MAITYVSNQENSAGGGASSPWTISINIGTRTNGLLVVCLGGYLTGGGFDAISMTYAGVALAKDIEVNETQYVSVWHLAAPANGTNNLVITFTPTSGGVWFDAYVLTSWYDGAHQTQATVKDQTNSGTGSTDPTLSVTPTENNELLVGIYFSGQGTVLTTGADETILANESFGGQCTGGSYAIQTTAGAQAVNYSGNDAAWAEAVATYKQAAAAGGRTTKNTDSHPLGIHAGISRRVNLP